MARLKGAAVTLAAVLLGCATAHAQIGGHPFEFSGGAGWSEPDSRSNLRSGRAMNAAIGYRMNSFFTLEGQGTWIPSELDVPPGSTRNFTLYGLDGRLNLRPAEGQLVPFLLGGFGYGVSHDEAATPAKLERGAPTAGMGLLWNALAPNVYLRFQVRDILFRERESSQFSNYLMATAGIQYLFGGRNKDQDLDGVRDWLDQCANTPIGARVDERGCPVDSDRDSVFDGLDKCENTPAGCSVDKDGCPRDADGDGVCDGVDRCADTPKGARVDAAGCPMDSDGDGVFDGIDQCEGTVKGCTVDERGCPADSDGDGVCDGVDQCPNTPSGLRVDANGCPIEVSEKETQLLDTGTIRLQNVEFDTGKASLRPVSFPVLDEVGGILQQYPTLQIEIGGHTDNRGTDAANQRLSQARADSVRAYMRERFPLIPATQLTAKGYGEGSPIAPNTSEVGRARNRRVEFKVMNSDALRIEREKRRFLKVGEGAPADTTQR
jgi:OOP family OmpA-OmpF porin